MSLIIERKLFQWVIGG